MTNEQMAVVSAFETGDFEKAVELHALLPQGQERHARVLFAKADSLYEMGKDLESLTEYVRYLSAFPGGKGRDYAKMAIVAVLKNLHLDSLALDYLQSVAGTHPGRSKEIAESHDVLRKQEDALRILSKLKA